MRNVSAIPLTGSDQGVRSGACRYLGYTIHETAGSVAVVKIYDGTTAAGTLLDTISLAAAQSLTVWYPGGGDVNAGIQAEAGIYVKITSGTVEGSVRVLR